MLLDQLKYQATTPAYHIVDSTGKTGNTGFWGLECSGGSGSLPPSCLIWCYKPKILGGTRATLVIYICVLTKYISTISQKSSPSRKHLAKGIHYAVILYSAFIIPIIHICLILHSHEKVCEDILHITVNIIHKSDVSV